MSEAGRAFRWGRLVAGLVAATLVLALVYVGSALAMLADLGDAARRGDAARVLALTDTVRLRRSLVGQVSSVFSEVEAARRPMSPLERQAMGSLAATVIDAYVQGLLTPEAITDLLRAGRIGQGATAGVDLPRLTDLPFDAPLSLLGRISVVRLTELAVRISPEGAPRSAVRVRFDLPWQWRLGGIDLPRDTLRQLVASARRA